MAKCLFEPLFICIFYFATSSNAIFPSSFADGCQNFLKQFLKGYFCVGLRPEEHPPGWSLRGRQVELVGVGPLVKSH